MNKLPYIHTLLCSEFQLFIRCSASHRRRCCNGGYGLSHPVHVRLSSPLPHGEDPCCLVPGALEELVESTLQAMPVLCPLTQGEDARCRISCERPPVALSARATQQHVEAARTGRLPAALGHVVSITGQLR